MKKLSFFCRLAAVLTALSTISSCRSAETAAKIPDTTAFSITDSIITGNFAGIELEPGEVTAASAVPFPDTASTSASETDQPDKTDVSTGAAETSAETFVTTTTTAHEETTTSAAVTTTASEAAAVTTTTEISAAATTVTTTTETSTTTTTATAAEITTAAAAIPASYPKNSYSAIDHSYVKAAWISYIELYDHLYGKDGSGLSSAFGAMLDNCAAIGINTVYVHVRAFGDAYYFSELFPFTKRLRGTVDARTGSDPLSLMLAEAHKRGMSFHAWINPLRLGPEADVAAIPESFPVGKWYRGGEKGSYIVNVNGTWYLNPAYDEVRKLIGDGVREIVSGYDVDGVHIDDYFYPTTDAGFDSAAFASSGYSDLARFRIDKCSAMVKEIWTAAHECGSALFGAAPQGNNINNLNMLYADTRAWCSGGYIDYFAPQLYYGFENSGVPFGGCADEWAGIVNGTKTRLIAGLSVYKAGNEDKWAGTGINEWKNTDTMLKRQKEYADADGFDGIALYSYSYLFDSGYMTPAMKAEKDNLAPLLTNG